jgi:hypothetical protein
MQNICDLCRSASKIYWDKKGRPAYSLNNAKWSKYKRSHPDLHLDKNNFGILYHYAECDCLCNRENCVCWSLIYHVDTKYYYIIHTPK